MEKVESIELSGEHIKLRLALVGLLAGFGVLAIMYGVLQLLSANEGWNQITTDSTYGLGCGSDFILEYNLGSSGISATAEKKEVRRIYSEGCVYTYHLFSNDDLSDDPVDYLTVYDINQHPNEVLEIEDTLYQAFALAEETGSRYLYLAPIYSYYQNLFSCLSSEDTYEFDPLQNEEIAAFYKEVAAIAADPEMVQLQLLGDDQICLMVSDEYLAYAETEGITDFIDFGWMTNAFIIDYLADSLIEAGHSYGTISSYDGFSRNMDENTEHTYSNNLYDLLDGTVYDAAKLTTCGRTATCFLRTYPMTSQDSYHYFELADGEIRHPYINAANGLPQTGGDNLFTWTGSSGCAKLLLETIPVFLTEESIGDHVAEWKGKGISAVWFEENRLCCNTAEAQISDLCQDPVSFVLELVDP